MPAASIPLEFNQHSLTPVEDASMFVIQACGHRTPSSPTLEVGVGGLEPRTESAVLGGLQFTPSDFSDFFTHGPHMRIDGLSVSSRRIVACVSASIATVYCRPCLSVFTPAANTSFAPVFVVHNGGNQGSAEKPAAATFVAQRALSSTNTLHGEEFAVSTAPAVSVFSVQGSAEALAAATIVAQRVPPRITN